MSTRTVSGQGTFVADGAGNVTFTLLATLSGTCATTCFVHDTGGLCATIQATVGPMTNDDVGLVTYQTARKYGPTDGQPVAASRPNRHAHLHGPQDRPRWRRA